MFLTKEKKNVSSKFPKKETVERMNEYQKQLINYSIYEPLSTNKREPLSPDVKEKFKIEIRRVENYLIKHQNLFLK